ncbi:MAG: zinc ribbon domain-containing protein [Nitrososphaerota archaeon]
MVYCSRCGREVDPQWTHCPYCGNPLTPAYQRPVPKKKSRRSLVAALIGLSGFLGLGYVAYRYYGDEIIAFIESISGQVRPSTEIRTTTLTKTSELTTSQSSATTPSTPIETQITTTSQVTTTTPSLTTQLTTTQTETSMTTTSSATSTYTVSGMPERAWDSIAYPYLVVGGQAYYEEVKTSVTNEGDAPSFYTVLELYQGPVPSRIPGLKYIEHPLRSFKLTWRKIITLNPGQRIDLDLSGITPQHEVLVWVCYDPILDPRGFRMESDAELRSIYRGGPDRDRHVIAMGRSGALEG